MGGTHSERGGRQEGDKEMAEMNAQRRKKTRMQRAGSET